MRISHFLTTLQNVRKAPDHPNYKFCFKNFKSWKNAQFLFQGFAEDLSQFPDNSFDAVIETLVLCSVSDVSKSLKEIHRILKPSGKFYFFDHIFAPSDEKLLRSIQYLMTKTVCYLY